MTARVVHVIRSQGFSGVERYVVQVSNELALRGWSVQVVGGDEARMRTSLLPIVGFRPGPSTSAATRQVLRCRPVDLIHAHMTAGETAGVLTKPLTHARVISTRHFAGPRGANLAVRVAGRALARAVDQEIAISRFVADSIGGAPAVLLHGVRDEPQAHDAPVVLVMQRLELEKDTALALDAFRRSRIFVEGWRLRIAGRGSQADNLRRSIRELHLVDQVDLLGFVEDPAGLRAQGGVFLAPAPAEPLGLSVLEAMAAGLPVAAARGGAHEETLGTAGMFFDAGDPAGCAAALDQYANPALRLELGRRGRLRQQREFTLAGHVDGLVRIYEQVLAR